MARTREYAILALVFIALPAVSFSAGPEIFLREDPEMYLVIDKLQATGLLPEIMTGERGLDVSEVAREAKKVEWVEDPFVEYTAHALLVMRVVTAFIDRAMKEKI